MSNPSKTKGTAAETAVVRYLQGQGWPWAERRALHGNADRGDIAGLPGVVIEVKNCAKLEPGAWLREAQREQANAGADVGLVWAKRRGTTDPADWFVIMDGKTAAQLLKAAGW